MNQAIIAGSEIRANSKKLVLHSDRGCQYTSYAFRRVEETTFSEELFAWGLDNMLADPNHVLLAAVIHGEVIGFLHLRMEFQLHHCAEVGEIMELIVSSSARSQGVGKSLLDAAKMCVSEMHCTQIEVTSNRKRTNAHRFYQREQLEMTHVKLTKPLT
ncbi:GNAT family N-acetyltransferase [Ruminococcus callidus]|uniref:GNAT family N-acetyltransferase n=1 Tax=Ruminococcus callidus TaxID=40519 RepID=UPI0023F15B9F|nr:GNAT family N-acetyltransferase [Ruminococcus callidus]